MYICIYVYIFVYIYLWIEVSVSENSALSIIILLNMGQGGRQMKKESYLLGLLIFIYLFIYQHFITSEIGYILVCLITTWGTCFFLKHFGGAHFFRSVLNTNLLYIL